MKRNRFSRVLTLAAVAMATFAFTGASASAALVAADLNTGGADTGFSGGWEGSNNVFIVTTPDLTYANYSITQTGTTDRVYSGNTNHTDRMDSRDLAAAMSGDIWFSALVNVPTGTNFAGLAFDSDPWNSSGSAKYSHQLSELRVVLNTSQLVVDMDGGAPPTATGTETGTFAADTTHLVLGNMNVGAGNDTLSVWVDPDVNAALPAANFSSTTVDFMDSVVRVGVPASGASGVFVDAIRVSDTATAFEDVTGVVAGGGGGELAGQLGILTPETLAGNNPATGAPWAAGDQYRFAFHTSANTTAESSDIATYNAWVQGLADASTAYEIGADDGATWKAIGSTDAVDARDNTATNVAVNGNGEAIFLLDGSTVVATDYADLWDGDIQNIINLTEQGTEWAYWPFTGTQSDGTAAVQFGPLGTPISGNISQGYAGDVTQWIWRAWTGDPANTQLPMYALSDPLVIVSESAVVPEPSTFALAALGLLGLAWFGLRRRKA